MRLRARAGDFRSRAPGDGQREFESTGHRSRQPTGSNISNAPLRTCCSSSARSQSDGKLERVRLSLTCAQYLSCLSTSTSNDKLAFDVGLKENAQGSSLTSATTVRDRLVLAGESCWWTLYPASKQRSEGEKVRFNDDVILVSVFSERYLVRRVNPPFRVSFYLPSRLARVHVHERSRPSECLLPAADLESRADLQRRGTGEKSRIRARWRRDSTDAWRDGSLYHHFSARRSNERRCREVSDSLSRNAVLTKTFFSSVYSSRVVLLAIRLDRSGASNVSRPSRRTTKAPP